MRICVEEGIDAVTAIRMATLNAAECFGLREKGAIAPGYHADIVLLNDLKDFHVDKVWIAGICRRRWKISSGNSGTYIRLSREV